MKYLGIDYGTKRIGLAMTDDEGRMAFPDEVVANNSQIIDILKKKIKENNIKKVILGESKNYKMEDNKIMNEILDLKKIIEEVLEVDVELQAEFMTSMQAEKIQGKNEMIDASAACIILQTYLDSYKNKKMTENNIKKEKNLDVDDDSKISFDDFIKVEMRIGEITKAEKVENTDRLLRLSVDFGTETRQIISGIAEFYEVEDLPGLKCPFVTNLKPRNIKGEESNGMILAAKDNDGNFSILKVDQSIAKGTKLS